MKAKLMSKPKPGRPPVSPAVRRRARECAVQFLFGLEFTEYEFEPALKAFWETFEARPAAREYASALVRGIHEQRAALDEAIGEASQNWTTGRIGPLERNILRVAVYEMRFRDDVPAGVAINEAIEIAKRYATDDAPRFVNGVLDKLKPG